jgi:hypothetical protein
MMDRGVMGRQMFRNGGMVRYMQAGGDPMMAPPAAEAPMAAPIAAAAAGPMPQSAQADQVVAGAMGQGLDPAVLESMLQQMSGSYEGIDAAAENEDYEGVINSIRGDQATLEERRMELAGVVGDQDAAQTPDSVLTLVQPIMQIAAVDQGIGSVAPEAMNTPVQGDMAGGIMSTVNMPREQAQAMPGQGGPAPVNFNQGGAVQYFAPENENRVAMPNARQQQLFNEQRALYGQLFNPEERAKDLEDQRQLTQAQMLFDIAQGGLMMATPGERNVSPVSRFAEAFTPVLGNVGARAGEFGKFKQGQKAEQRQLDLAALQGAQTLYGAERQAQLSAADKDIGDVYSIAVTETVDGEPVTRSLGTRPLTRSQLEAIYDQYGMENVTIRAIPTASGTPQSAENFKMPDGSVDTAIPGTQKYLDLLDAGGNIMGVIPGTPESAENFVLADGSQTSAVPGTPLYDQVLRSGGLRLSNVSQEMLVRMQTDREQVTLTMDVTIGDRTYRAGSSPNLTTVERDDIARRYGNAAYTAYVAPVSERDFFNRFGMSQTEFNNLSETQQQYLQGLPVLTDRDYFSKFGMDRNGFEALSLDDRNVLLGIDPKYRFERLQGDDGSITIVRINERTGDSVDILSRDVSVDPSYFRITMPDATGRNITRVVDIKTPEGQAVVADVNRLNSANPGTATMFRLGTEDVTPRGFYVPGTDAYESGVYTSYDGGRTFTDMRGVQHAVPPNGFEVSNTIAYEVNRNARVSAGAQAALDAMENDLVSGMTDAEGNPLSQETRNNIRDSLRQARQGTGFWSKVYAGIDGLLGGTIAPEYFGEMFRNTQDARQYVEMVRVFGRSALSASPRFAVADLEATAQLFPDERAFFRNPTSEARKLTRLAEELRIEKARILTLRASGDPIDSALNATLSQKLFEIERLEGLLGPILTLSNTANAADLTRAQEIVDRATGLGD